MHDVRHFDSFLYIGRRYELQQKPAEAGRAYFDQEGQEQTRNDQFKHGRSTEALLGRGITKMIVWTNARDFSASEYSFGRLAKPRSSKLYPMTQMISANTATSNNELVIPKALSPTISNAVRDTQWSMSISLGPERT